MKFAFAVRALLGAAALWVGSAQADVTLLNVAYDVTREFYKDINAAFVEHWRKTTGERIVIEQSHGGRGQQDNVGGQRPGRALHLPAVRSGSRRRAARVGGATSVGRTGHARPLTRNQPLD